MNTSTPIPPEDPHLTDYQKEIKELREQLAQRTAELHRLLHWTQLLQQDISAVYHSVTWKMGNALTRLILYLLRRPVGVTARDHIYRLFNNVENFKTHYFQTLRTAAATPQPFIWHDTHEYARWIQQFDTPDNAEYAAMQHQVTQWQTRPVVSLLMPIYESIPATWQETLQSVRQQIYPHWQLLIAADEAILTRLKPLVPSDNRICFCPIFAEKIDTATLLNHAYHAATGEFIGIIGHADQLPSHALYTFISYIFQNPTVDLIYSDEDYLNAQGQRSEPFFKPDWNPDLLTAQPYLGHLTLIRRTHADTVGKFHAYPDGTDYDFLLRCTENINPDKILHIPQVLYHAYQKSAALQIVESAGDILRAHFIRKQQVVMSVSRTPTGQVRIKYPLPTPKPLVSLIIPTRDRLPLLRTTLKGILEKTDYAPLEVIIVDNGSCEAETLTYLKKMAENPLITVIRDPSSFNYSRLNNLGFKQAKGEIIGLLNNDLDIIHADWLEEMVSHAIRPDIGAVGAKLYFADETIQHAGVVIGLGGMAGHSFRFLAREMAGYAWRPFVLQNCSVVTGACLLLRREVYAEVGGLDEQLAVAFNDVDLCLRIRQRGYRIVWTPFAELYHLESASRGLDNTPFKYLRLRRELNFMLKRWKNVLAQDPYYNPNLTIEYEDFSLAYPPRQTLIRPKFL